MRPRGRVHCASLYASPVHVLQEKARTSQEPVRSGGPTAPFLALFPLPGKKEQFRSVSHVPGDRPLCLSAPAPLSALLCALRHAHGITWDPRGLLPGWKHQPEAGGWEAREGVSFPGPLQFGQCFPPGLCSLLLLPLLGGHGSSSHCTQAAFSLPFASWEG